VRLTGDALMDEFPRMFEIMEPSGCGWLKSRRCNAGYGGVVRTGYFVSSGAPKYFRPVW
jgi:hypothetical protein